MNIRLRTNINHTTFWAPSKPISRDSIQLEIERRPNSEQLRRNYSSARGIVPTQQPLTFMIKMLLSADSLRKTEHAATVWWKRYSVPPHSTLNLWDNSAFPQKYLTTCFEGSFALDFLRFVATEEITKRAIESSHTMDKRLSPTE